MLGDGVARILTDLQLRINDHLYYILQEKADCYPVYISTSICDGQLSGKMQTDACLVLLPSR